MLWRRKRHRPPPPGIFIGPRALSWIDTLRHVFVTGAPGSGKSHFLMRVVEQLVGRACLVITTVKPTDVADVMRVLERRGLSHLAIRLGIGSPHKLNPGQFFTKTLPGGSPRTLTKIITLVAEVLQNSGSERGEQFWSQLIADTAYYCTLLCLLATGRANLADIYRIVMALPSSADELAQDSYYQRPCGQFLLLAKKNRPSGSDVAYQQVVDFVERMAHIGAKARTAGTQGAGSALAGLVNDFGESVCSDSNVDLAECEREKRVLIIDGCPMRYHDAGRAFNFLMCAAVQYWCIARDPEGLDTPTFLIRDECAWSLSGNAHEAPILAVARSQKLACISAVQNLPILTAGLGGDERARHEAEAFASLHATHVHFANVCPETNELASKVCGESKQIHLSGGGDCKRENTDLWDTFLGATKSYGWHEAWERNVREGELMRLRRGEALLVTNGSFEFIDLWEGSDATR